MDLATLVSVGIPLLVIMATAPAMRPLAHPSRSGRWSFKEVIQTYDTEPVAGIFAILIAGLGLWLVLPWGTTTAFPIGTPQVPIGLLMALTGTTTLIAMKLDLHRTYAASIAASMLVLGFLAISGMLSTGGHSVIGIVYGVPALAELWVFHRLNSDDDALRAKGLIS